MKRRISDILLELGFISRDRLSESMAASGGAGNRLNDILLKKGHITHEQLQLAVAVKEGAKLLDAETVVIDQKLLAEIPHDFVKKHHVFPFAREGNIIKAAAGHPFDSAAREELTRLTGCKVATYIAPRDWISKNINLYFDTSRIIDGDIEVFSRAKRSAAARFKKDRLATLATRLIEKGRILGAADIHVVPDTNLSRIYYRIDGVLHQQYLFPAGLHPGLVAAYKSMAGIDASRSALPSDGRISYRGVVGPIDIRISSLPTHQGETIVMRLLSCCDLIGNLDELGFEPRDLSVFKKSIRRPYGFILAAGPAESGKTTTVYSALMQLNRSNVNVMTVEDPIEYAIPSVRQTAVNQADGLTFGNALKSAMNQDPNIIFVGELTDRETTDLALQAAMSGHLVLSTLRSNDAASAVTRLLDLGTNKNMLASSLAVIVAQRLMRKICDRCFKAAVPSDEERDIFIQYHMEPPKEIPKPVGCEHCFHTGYSGRTAIFEVFPVDRSLKELIFSEAMHSAIEDHAVQNGASLFPRQALKKVIARTTSLEEVHRVIAIP